MGLGNLFTGPAANILNSFKNFQDKGKIFQRVQEPKYACLITLDTPLIPSKFVDRRTAGLLSYHLRQMMFLE